MISGRKIMKKMEVTIGGTRNESKRAIKYLGVITDERAREIHRRKGICNTESTGENDAKYWSSNVDNAVCLANMVGGTHSGDDKNDTVLGVSSERD